MYPEVVTPFLPRARKFLTTAGQSALVLAGFVAPISITATDICVAAAALLSVISGEFFAKLKTLKSNPMVISVLLILAMVVMGMLWSTAPFSYQTSALHKYGKLLYIPFLIPLAMDIRWRERTMSAFLFAMVITVTLSYFKAYAGLSFGKLTPASVFHNHIETSYFVALATYILAYRAWHHHKYYRWYWVLAAIFSYQEFFINDGRTGYVAYIVLFFLFFIQHMPLQKASTTSEQNWVLSFKSIKTISCSSILLLGLVLFGYQLYAQMHREVVNSSGNLTTGSSLLRHSPDPSIQFRLKFIEFSGGLIKEHPILGLGTGGFKAAYRQSPTIPIPEWGSRLDTPHNEYLLMAVQFGIVGLILLLYFFYVQIRMSFHLISHQYIAQALIFSYLFSCCYNNFLYSSVTGYFYVIFSSLLFAETGFKRGFRRFLA